MLADVLRGAVDDADINTGATTRAKMAHDASHFLLVPQAVVVARDAGAVSRLMASAAANGLHVTFRAGGTSLSGQGGTDGVLVDVRRHFRAVEVLDGGLRVRCEPGVTVRTVNARLAAYGRRIGPDPASEGSCTLGGVVANNSSGMSCGTHSNAYRTLRAVTVVLPTGTVVDTGAPDADDRLRAAEPGMHAGLLRLRDRIRANPDSMARIAHQYSMKNTMGYSLNAFTDFERPADILAHLIVGSEGTLGFIASVTLDTVPELLEVSTGLLIFPDLGSSMAALDPLLSAGASTLELLDAVSLRVSQRGARATADLARLTVDGHAALLVETRANSAAELADLDAAMARAAASVRTAVPPSFSSAPAGRADLWAVRKGLYAAVAAARAPGTTALLEDVAVPFADLPATTADLIDLLAAHAYRDAVIFGHAKDGNLHFMINPRLDDPAELLRYEAFTEDLVDLVLGHDGSLKAEHGTGRMMTPYVERQFGTELHSVMRAVKDLLDPRGILSPGVVLGTDPRGHVSHLKTVPTVDPLVDACVDCGFCEPVCPSGDLTTTPRQRIALLREIALAPPERRAELQDDYGYEAVQTCAADSLCATACPVAIDTGKLMKQFRAEANSARTQKLAVRAATSWGPVTSALRSALAVNDTLPPRLTASASGAARRVLSDEWVPAVGEDLPGPGPRRRALTPEHPDVVLFATCVNSLFGPTDAGHGATGAFLRLCARAGLTVAVPEPIAGLCCGTPWQSKGLTDGHAEMARRTFEALWTATRGGAVPVVADASSCTHGLQSIGAQLPAYDRERFAALDIIDAVPWAARELLPRLTVRSTLGSVVLHPTCSSVHIGGLAELHAIAQACAAEVVVPVDWACCAFAGDRGMLHPELTASATRREAAEVVQRPYDAYVSSNRTCEMGMTRATGRTYRHVLELLDDLV